MSTHSDHGDLIEFNDEPSPSKRTKSCRSKRAIDRISTLPDSLIVHILSFLPIEDAIKTEVLSKRWEYLWTCVPALLFRFHYSDYDDYKYRDICDFVTFVDKTLVLCNGSRLQKFGVDFNYEPRFASNVNLWTRFAARNGTEVLRLEFDAAAEGLAENECYELPQLLYTNSSFRELHFTQCNVIPKGVVCWKSLKKLSIGHAKLSDDVIQKILAGCPVLEIFELNFFYGVNRLHVSNASVKKLILRDFWKQFGFDEEDESGLEISAPNLQSLEIFGGFEWRNCRLGDVSSLVDASLNFNLSCSHEDYNDYYESHRNTLTGILQSLVHVKNLTLGKWVIQVLSMMEAKGLHSPLSKCKFLTLDTQLEKSVLPGIASLLESSPNLETLVITMSSSRNWDTNKRRNKIEELCNFNGQHYWTSQKRTFKCLMLHLKTVKLSGLTAYYSDLSFSFVQFLLKNARVLQKMVINMIRKDSKMPEELFQAAQKCLSFPRSSPDAVVMMYARNGQLE